MHSTLNRNDAGSNPASPTKRDRKAYNAYMRRYMRLLYHKRRKEYFKDKRCVDCGRKKGLEADHVDPKTKTCGRRNWWLWPKDRREAELKKCVPRCYRCHRKRTAKQQQRDTPHGTISGYFYRKCRCAECRKCYAAYRKQRRPPYLYLLTHSEFSATFRLQKVHLYVINSKGNGLPQRNLARNGFTHNRVVLLVKCGYQPPPQERGISFRARATGE